MEKISAIMEPVMLGIVVMLQVDHTVTDRTGGVVGHLSDQ